MGLWLEWSRIGVRVRVRIMRPPGVTTRITTVTARWPVTLTAVPCTCNPSPIRYAHMDLIALAIPCHPILAVIEARFHRLILWVLR